MPSQHTQPYSQSGMMFGLGFAGGGSQQYVFSGPCICVWRLIWTWWALRILVSSGVSVQDADLGSQSCRALCMRRYNSQQPISQPGMSQGAHSQQSHGAYSQQSPVPYGDVSSQPEDMSQMSQASTLDPSSQPHGEYSSQGFTSY